MDFISVTYYSYLTETGGIFAFADYRESDFKINKVCYYVSLFEARVNFFDSVICNGVDNHFIFHFIFLLVPRFLVVFLGY